MKCEDIMSKNLEYLNEKETVLKAAALMADVGVGFLPICDAERRVIGVVTDRDLTTRGIARHVAPATTPAALLMTSPAVCCLETADVRVAEELMATERKSRVVITDAQGRLTGVLSVADLVEHAPGRQALQTLRAVLWREALGPRGGALRDEPLLKDEPIAPELPPSSDDVSARASVFTGGHRATDTTEFPG